MSNQNEKIIKRLDAIIGLLLDLIKRKDRKLSERDKIEALYRRDFGVGEIGVILGKDSTKISKQLYFVKKKRKKGKENE